jgi:hypothetical protein
MARVGNFGEVHVTALCYTYFWNFRKLHLNGFRVQEIFVSKLKQVKLKGSRFQLLRDRDGMGDSGPMFLSIDPKTGKPEEGIIKEGCCIRCGSFIARSYSSQDYWTTTPVTKILKVEEKEEKHGKVQIVTFETRNSTYVVTTW